MFRYNRGVSGYAPSAIRASRPVMFDANVLMFLTAWNKQWQELTKEQKETARDYRAFIDAIGPIWNREHVEVPAYVMAELSRRVNFRGGDAAVVTLARQKKSSNDLSVRDFNAFTQQTSGMLLPNKSVVDKMLIADAWMNRKYIVSLDAWVVGTAQATGTIHPVLKKLRFGNVKTEKLKQAAFNAWGAGDEEE